MINWSDVNLLEKQKLEKQIELNELLHSKEKDSDKASEIKAEILYLDKQIKKIVGSNEIKRQEELKNKRSGREKSIRLNYDAFKARFEKINPMSIATSKIVTIIKTRNEQEFISERVKVKS